MDLGINEMLIKYLDINEIISGLAISEQQDIPTTVAHYSLLFQPSMCMFAHSAGAFKTSSFVRYFNLCSQSH